MTDKNFPELGELAALLALDALEPDEQADAELRLGSFNHELGSVVLPLGEALATEPPADLKNQVLAAARSRRTSGRPAATPEEITPAEAFSRTIEDLFALLVSLSPEEWEVVAHEEHGKVRDLIAHLIGVERLNLRWLDPDDQVPPLVDHVASTRDIVASLADVAPAELARQWHESATAMLAVASAGPRDQLVVLHDLLITVDGLLTTRTFELWAHGMDIAVATGRSRPMLDDARMLLMSSRLMGALPLALAYRGVEPVEGTARFVLTGPAGGCYDVPLNPTAVTGEAASVTVVADVIDLCRVASDRLTLEELNLTVLGDAALADLVMAHVNAFARD